MYSCTLSLTLAVDVVGSKSHAPAALLAGKTPYPLCRRLGAPQSGRVRKISSLPGFDPRTFQPLASCHTDYAISTHSHSMGTGIFFRGGKTAGCEPDHLISSAELKNEWSFTSAPLHAFKLCTDKLYFLLPLTNL
jgi:hypothetical protein